MTIELDIKVWHDDSLVGDGTQKNPLRVAGNTGVKLSGRGTQNDPLVASDGGTFSGVGTKARPLKYKTKIKVVTPKRPTVNEKNQICIPGIEGVEYFAEFENGTVSLGEGCYSRNRFKYQTDTPVWANPKKGYIFPDGKTRVDWMMGSLKLAYPEKPTVDSNDNICFPKTPNVKYMSYYYNGNEVQYKHGACYARDQFRDQQNTGIWAVPDNGYIFPGNKYRIDWTMPNVKIVTPREPYADSQNRVCIPGTDGVEYYIVSSPHSQSQRVTPGCYPRSDFYDEENSWVYAEPKEGYAFPNNEKRIDWHIPSTWQTLTSRVEFSATSSVSSGSQRITVIEAYRDPRNGRQILFKNAPDVGFDSQLEEHFCNANASLDPTQRKDRAEVVFNMFNIAMEGAVASIWVTATGQGKYVG